MPRVSTQTARKDYPQFGIKKGDVYYSWAFAFGPKLKSKTPPKQSQLTQSEYLGRIYDLQDSASTSLSGASTLEELQGVVESFAADIREIGTEQEEKRSNMPDQLQDAPSGALLEERAQACEECADNLEGMDFEPVEDEDEDVTVDRLADEARDFISELC